MVVLTDKQSLTVVVLTDKQKLARMKQRRRRLLVLADFLEKKVKPKLNGAKFYMGTWGETASGVGIEKVKTLDDTEKCGYVACAIGWGVVCPELRRPLLAARYTSNYRNRDSHDFSLIGIADVFGLTYDEAEKIFMPRSYGSGYRTPNPRIETVIKRIRQAAAREPKLTPPSWSPPSSLLA